MHRAIKTKRIRVAQAGRQARKQCRARHREDDDGSESTFCILEALYRNFQVVRGSLEPLERGTSGKLRGPRSVRLLGRRIPALLSHGVGGEGRAQP
jgi:hypothetical protein